MRILRYCVQMRLILLCISISLVAVIYSCGGSEAVSPSSSANEDSVIVAHLDTMNVTYERDASGLYYYPITMNPTGKTQSEGSILSFYYNISVLGGQTLEVVDSTSGDPVRMKRGVNAIYPLGVDQALAYLKEGETWGFVVPSRLAYGAYSSSLIPDNAIITLIISLSRIQNDNDIRSEDNQKVVAYADSLNLSDTVQYPLNQPEILQNGMIYKRVAVGVSEQQPAQNNTATITYKLSLAYENEPVDVVYAGEANPFVFSFGNQAVFEGLEFGVGKIQKGERALLVIPSLLGYRESVGVIPSYLAKEMADRGVIPTYAAKVQPYEILVVETKLLDIQ